MNKIATFLISLFFISVISYSQDGGNPTLPGSSFAGTHFYVGFMQNENYIIYSGGGILLSIFISPSAPANIDLSVPGYYFNKYSIDKDSILFIRIPEGMENRISEDTSKKVVEIKSDVPISVYSVSSQNATSEAYAAIPVENWGMRYVVMSYPNDSYDLSPYDSTDSLSQIEPRCSEFMIMAAYDSTLIEFSPRAVTEKIKQIGNYYKVLLKKGECYLVKSYKTQRGTGDLTGTIITGNQPFGVLSGHVRTAIPQNYWYPENSKNHLIEMLAPTEAWGKTFISVPFYVSDIGDMFRITCIEPQTVISMQTDKSTKNYVLTNPGDFQTIYNISEPALWFSNKPIQIAQYMMRSGKSSNDYYDPSMVMLSPVEQYISRVLFIAPDDRAMVTDDNFEHYVAIVADKAAMNNLVLDDQDTVRQLIGNFAANKVAGTDKYWARIPISEGKHKLTTGYGRFSGILYGTARRDAYAMALGSSLGTVVVVDTTPPVISSTSFCGKVWGTIIEPHDTLSRGIEYVRVLKDSTVNYKWTIGDVTDSTWSVEFSFEPDDVMQDGRFVFYVRDKNGNSTSYSYTYKGIKVSTPNEVVFNDIDWKDSTCFSFLIKNYGSDSVLVDSMYITKDSRLKFKMDKTLPLMLAPNESITTTVCFAPRGDTSGLSSELIIEFDCGRKYNLPIRGNVKALALVANDIDFGDVLVGDTLCEHYIVLVNKGNRSITIDSLQYFKYAASFWLLTKGKLPVTLNPGDSISIPVCFIPDTVSLFSELVYFANDKKIANQVKLTGNGVAPYIPKVIVDWKKRRLETKNDTTVAIKNIGSHTGRIKFNRIEYITGKPDFDTTALCKFESAIVKYDSLQLMLSFKPLSKTYYHAKVYFDVDWKYHGPFILELIGEGSIPGIETYNIDFGTIPVFSTKKLDTSLLKSIGNETLTIDDIQPDSGDVGSFDIDYNLLKNLKIDSGKVLNSKMSFSPLAEGPYAMRLKVTHDAAPNYRRDISYLTVKGYALNTLKPGLNARIIAPDSVIACQNSLFKVNLLNSGNVNLELKEITLIPTVLQANWAENLNLPVKLKVDSSIAFGVNVLIKRGESGSFKVIAVYEDTIMHQTKTDTLEYAVQPFANPLQIDNMEAISVTPGDTITLTVSGKAPNPIIINDNLHLTILVNQRSFLLTESEANLDILDSGDLKATIPVRLMQSINRVNIEIPAGIIKDYKYFEWKLKIPFLSLLSDEKISDISIIADADLCYNVDTMSINAFINGVCAFPLRGVDKDFSKLSFTVLPNPVTDKLHVDIYSPVDDVVNISLFDNIGKKYSLTENLFLKKGEHSLIFETGDYVSGVYVLKVQNSSEIKKLLLIISK